MERIVVNRSATLTRTFTAAPTGTPTVEVTRADGTVVTVGSVTGATDTWSYTIPATSNTQLDLLTETWTATIGGVAQEFVDYVEVAGGVLFNITDLQAALPSSKTAQTMTEEQIADVRTLVEQALEDACGVAFVPRYAVQTINGPGTTTLMLKWPYVRAIRTLEFDGVAGVPGDVAFQPSGIAYYPSGWTAGHSNIVIGYEHGHDTPPLRVRQAALLLAKDWLLNSPVDSRATSISNDDGTFALMTPGLRGSIFGLPEVDVVVQQYSLAVSVA